MRKPFRPSLGSAGRLAAVAAIASIVWSCSSSASGAGANGALASAAPAASTAGITVAGATETPSASPNDSPSAEPSASSVSLPTPLQTMISTPEAPRPALQPTPRPVTVTIAAAGDIACDPAHNVGTPQDCDQVATAALIGQLRPTAVMTLGDNQYEDGTLAAFQQIFGPSWGQYKSKLFPTIGNHEYLTSGAKGYFDYFNFPAYYSFNLGNWHIVVLDSECHYVGGCSSGSAQEKWFLADLAAHPSLCTMVTWHEPSWSSGEHGDASQMKTIWADLVKANVDVVLTGHNHDYERFVPLDSSGQPDPSGTTEFVVGTGGKNHYGFVDPPLAGEVVRNDQSFGVIQMALGPTSYSWKFVPAPGYSFTDSGSANCH
jgi:hypothetical protein